MGFVVRRLLLFGMVILAGIAGVVAVVIHLGGVGHAASNVSVEWSDSTGRVSWSPVSGAAGYEVTLIRTTDNAVMERIRVPATQTVADVQGLWYGVTYAVAVQATDDTGTPGPAAMSATGSPIPISRSTFNGFLDTENVKAGPIDPNLWDQRIYDSNLAHEGETFVNGQLHYHLEAGDTANTQSLASMRARVPVQLIGRTAHLHGEVDLKGDFHNWFGMVVSPQVISPDRVMDANDRFFFRSPTMPMIELFDDQDGVHILYASGHSSPQDLGHVPNPTKVNNVRDTVDWWISTTQTRLSLNGNTVLSASWPSPLGFTTGYMTLFAEDYPNNTGGVRPPTACDGVVQDCNIWHLDNFGFDAPSGSQPTSAVYTPSGCAPYSAGRVVTQECHGNVVTIPDISTVTQATAVFEVKNPGSVSVSVNGGATVPVAYPTEQYIAQEYAIPIPLSSLRAGDNRLTFQTGGSASVFNVQIETLSSVPYAPPPEPPQPAPLGIWNGGAPSAPSASPTATTSGGSGTGGGFPQPKPISVNNVPCMVTMNGVQQQGMCSGTFTPAQPSAPTSTPTTGPGPSPTTAPNPSSTVTAPPPPPIGPSAGGARQAGINAEPSMRPWRYSGPNPDGWWCQAPNCYQNADPMVTINSELTLARHLGVANVRLEFPWALIETGQGVYDWSRADAIVQAAQAHGVILQPVVVYTPSWASSGATMAPNPQDFGAFIAALASRYKGRFPVIELWNEPDHPHYWNSGEQAYIDSILKPGYAAIKAADPSVQVELGSPSWANGGWLNGIYSGGGGNSFDIMGWHDYSGGGQILADAQNVAALLANHGQASKPVWLGEYGVQESSLSDTQQQGLLSQVLTASNSPIAMAQWYNLRDDNSMTCCPPAVAVSASWGLVQHDDATMKQGYTTLQQLIAAGLPKHT